MLDLFSPTFWWVFVFLGPNIKDWTSKNMAIWMEKWWENPGILAKAHLTHQATPEHREEQGGELCRSWELKLFTPKKWTGWISRVFLELFGLSDVVWCCLDFFLRFGDRCSLPHNWSKRKLLQASFLSGYQGLVACPTWICHDMSQSWRLFGTPKMDQHVNFIFWAFLRYAGTSPCHANVPRADPNIFQRSDANRTSPSPMRKATSVMMKMYKSSRCSGNRYSYGILVERWYPGVTVQSTN